MSLGWGKMVFVCNVRCESSDLFAIDMFEPATVFAFKIEVVFIFAGLNVLVFCRVVLCGLDEFSFFFKRFNNAINRCKANLAIELFVQTLGRKIFL